MTTMKKTLYNKTYHGFENFSDYFRDVHEAVDPRFNPLMKDLPGEFQGKITVILTYEEDEK